MINLPFTLATRTSEMTSLIGIFETASAAEAAKHANESGITSGSEDIKVINT